MKRSLILAAVAAITTPAMAQFFGAPIADTAASAPAGTFAVSGGGVFGEYGEREADVTMYGVRLGYTVVENLEVFGDVGMVEIEEADAEMAFQGGALYTLPKQGDFDWALRATAGFVSYEGPWIGYDDDISLKYGAETDMISLTLCLLASMALDPVAVYTGAGVAHTEADFSAGSDNVTDPLLLAGVKVPLTDNLALYGEVVFIDGVNLGGGLAATL